MRNKYFYPIFKLKAKSWIRYWLLKKTEFKGKLSDILTGFSFNLQNTLRQKFVKFEIEGHSEQESTEGYQMLDTKSVTVYYIESGITLTKNEDGSLKTNTTTGYLKLNVPNTELEAGTYTFVRNFGGNYNSILKDSENNTIVSIGYGGTYKTITLTEEKTITVYQGAMLSTNCYFILYKGAYDSSKVYEKYTNGASPNPSYEQPIESCGENVNLFDKDNANIGYELIGSNGTTSANSNYYVSDYIPVNPNQNLYLTKGNNNEGQSNCFYDSNKIFISTVTKNYGLITVPNNSNIAYMRFNGNKNQLDTIKLEPGSKATPYSPYGMGSITEKIVNGNLIDELEIGSINAQGINEYSTIRKRTKNYIPIQPNSNYVLTSNANVWRKIFFFDKNKSLIRAIDEPIGTTYAIQAGEKEFFFREMMGDSGIAIENIQEQLELGSTATPYVQHEEQTYSIYTQQPMRSIGDVRDVFFKNTKDSEYYDENLVENGWYERHLPYIASYNNEVLPLDVYNEVGGIKYCNEKSMSTTGQFSLGASVQYLDESNWNCLLCTTEQTNILENIPSTFAGQTNVFSIDEVKAYLKIQYWESDTNG